VKQKEREKMPHFDDDDVDMSTSEDPPDDG
jgi:hypothetical protein